MISTELEDLECLPAVSGFDEPVMKMVNQKTRGLKCEERNHSKAP